MYAFFLGWGIFWSFIWTGMLIVFWRPSSRQDVELLGASVVGWWVSAAYLAAVFLAGWLA